MYDEFANLLKRSQKATAVLGLFPVVCLTVWLASAGCCDRVAVSPKLSSSKC